MREFRQFLTHKNDCAEKISASFGQERLMSRLDFSSKKEEMDEILHYFVSLEFYNPFGSSVII